MKQRFLVGCFVLLAASALAAAPPASGEEEELITKTFKIEYKEFQDAVLIVTDIVAREGSERNDVRLQHLLKRITVTDIRLVVDAVARRSRGRREPIVTSAVPLTATADVISPGSSGGPFASSCLLTHRQAALNEVVVPFRFRERRPRHNDRLRRPADWSKR